MIRLPVTSVQGQYTEHVNEAIYRQPVPGNLKEKKSHSNFNVHIYMYVWGTAVHCLKNDSYATNMTKVHCSCLPPSSLLKLPCLTRPFDTIRGPQRMELPYHYNVPHSFQEANHSLLMTFFLNFMIDAASSI